jgi:Fe-S-cluster containining protein
MTEDKELQAPELPEALRDQRQLALDEEFSFGCHSGLPCFTDCCGDVNIFLTPLDVLGLARRLGITTGEFLDQYTLTPITKDLHLPVVVFKMGDDEKKRCQLLGEQGCSVYEDRPWACRMYPVGMGIPPARAGVEPEPVYVLFENEFCKGHGEGQTWTVESWLVNQRISERDALETGWREIVSHPWFIGGRQLDPKRIEMFHTACYDLDKFRQFVFGSTFLQRFEVEDELMEQLRDDDHAMLQFAFRWLRFALFAEPTMQVRESATETGRNP